MKDFYVYLHRKASTGEVFYVGKGCGRRAWSTNRGGLWRRVVAKHGFRVEFVQTGLLEWAAQEMEVGLIALYGRRDLGHGCLINMTDGGDGWSNPSDELRRAKGDVFRRLHSTREFRDALVTRVRAMNADPLFKAKRADAMKSQNADPDFQRKRVASIEKMHSSESGFNAYRERALLMNSDPTFRKKQAESMARRRKPVICVETGRIFTHLKDAEEWLKSFGNLKARQSAISQCCNGSLRSAYCCNWKYV